MDNHITVLIVIHSLLMLQAAGAPEAEAAGAASAPKSPAHIQAEEDRILAIHFPNKDDEDDSDYDDDDDASAYDDEAYDEAQAAKFAGTSSLLTTAAAESHDQLPVFLEKPVSAFYTRQQPAQLRCRAANAVQLHIQCNAHLCHGQTETHVDPQTGVHVRTVTATVGKDALLLPAAESERSFRCECYAVSAHGQVKSEPPAHVLLAYIRKQFAVQPRSMRVHEGNRTEFRCGAPKGAPAPTVDWLRNGLPVRNDSAAVTIGRNGSLIIGRTGLKDTGNYTCVARNMVGTRLSDTVNLSVYADGGWSAWGAWADCGGCPDCKRPGRMRTRSCTQPVALNGGATCRGSATMQTKDCRNATAAAGAAVGAAAAMAYAEEIVHVPRSAVSTVASASAANAASLPVWTQWTEWAECSAECIQVRRRQCTDGARRMRSGCAGRDFQTQPCQEQTCAASSTGSSWMLFLGLGVVCGACLTAGAALTRCTRKRTARLPSYRSAQTDDLQLTESSKQDMALSDWRQHQFCAVV